jgi:uncharacterized membrane protein YkvA (DUF1232 family)
MVLPVFFLEKFLSDNDKPPRGFKSALKKATKIAADAQKTTALISSAFEKLQSHDGRIKRLRGELEALFRLVGKWVKGEYKKVPFHAIAAAIAAIIYFVNPLDMVHDYIPLVGYLDDAAILAFVLKSIKTDVDEFLIWEKHSKR